VILSAQFCSFGWDWAGDEVRRLIGLDYGEPRLFRLQAHDDTTIPAV
jgi:hypothetical protein